MRGILEEVLLKLRTNDKTVGHEGEDTHERPATMIIVADGIVDKHPEQATLLERLGRHIARETALRGGVDPVLFEAYEALSKQEPVDVILFCPQCGAKHVDKPEPEKGWDNPPHKSHLCHKCGTIWRAADVPTNGVDYPQTRGEHDTYRDAPTQHTAAKG